MRIEEPDSHVLMFVGEEVESVATAFIHGDEVLLVDSLASARDAAWLRDVICGQMGKTVRVLAATHYMSDHIAGMSLFPDALLLAHRYHRHAFLSQDLRADAFYREPDLVFDDMTLRWGAHELRLLHNPGKTMDHLSVDVPTADLVCAGDNIVGNIVYLSKSDPALLHAAIDRIRRFGRARVIGGHMGMFGAEVLDNALHYLVRLRDRVVSLRANAPSSTVDSLIADIRIEDCLAPQVQPTPFEREWHGNNLGVIVAQSIFGLDAALASRRRVA